MQRTAEKCAGKRTLSGRRRPRGTDSVALTPSDFPLEDAALMPRHIEDFPRMNCRLLRCTQPQERLRCEAEKHISSKFPLRRPRQFFGGLQQLLKSWRKRLRQSRRLSGKPWRNYYSNRKVLRPNDNHEEDNLGQIHAHRVMVLLSMRLGVQALGPAAWRHSRRDDAELRTPTR